MRGIILLILLLPLAVPADTLTGKVVKVTDGDTVYLRVPTTLRKTRLQGIDAPVRNQPYGSESTEHLAQLIASERVNVERTKRDGCRRIVGRILCEGDDICLEQVRAGYAWNYKKYPQKQSVEHGELYAQTEKQAWLAKPG